MAQTVNTRLKLRSDTEANWQQEDPVLLRGEAAFSYDVNKLKIGTGLKKWSQLEYLSGAGGGSVDASDLFVHVASRYELPNIGEKDKLYIDDSTGDIFVFGVKGSVYTSVGLAKSDTIYGGNATTIFN